MTTDERVAALVRLGYRVDVRDRGDTWRVMILRGVDVPVLRHAPTREEAVASAYEHVTRVPA